MMKGSGLEAIEILGREQNYSDHPIPESVVSFSLWDAGYGWQADHEDAGLHALERRFQGGRAAEEYS